MLVRRVFAAGLLATSLMICPASAESPQSGQQHLSYYTYYKVKSGETVSGIASKFGLAESSLKAMNPQLSRFDTDLPKGSLICVPKEDPPEVKKPKPKKTMEVETVASKPSTKKKRRRKKRKRREEPTKAEWDKLAELATKGAPKIAARRKTQSLGPPSKMIGSDGRVVYVPAARVKVAPPKPEKKRRRVKLSSRKGKAIHGVLKTCRSFMGTPYVWGGEQPGGFDCSGYIQYVWGKHGYRIPRTADIQYNVGAKVKRGKEKPGDLVFFETYAPGASHVGVYLGRGYFIHASSSRGVTIDRLATDFFAQRYLGAKRTDF